MKTLKINQFDNYSVCSYMYKIEIFNNHYSVCSYISPPSKKNPVFRVTQPYLNLLVKPRIFFMFSGKNIILSILKGEMPFKMHKIIFFPEKKNKKKIRVPTLPKSFETRFP